jgi:murein DD-endopeptidase MepM/ murein hydrolase activator NlpD
MRFLLPRLLLLLVAVAIIITFQLLSTLPLTQAQDPQPVPADPFNPIQPTPKPPFQLPFAVPPGPTTWVLGQAYGNTINAYYQRNTIYRASGGIHFGADFAAPCGTEIVAIGDGIVFAIDGPFGSLPHNLMIDHPQFGYASMYGHLLETPRLISGQQVKQGEIVALVGDAESDCSGGYPHLHLEIRDLSHIRKYNPALFIQANWNNLSLMGSSTQSFMRNLAAPRAWQTLYDQPEVQTGGPILNNFINTWPLDWSFRQ